MPLGQLLSEIAAGAGVLSVGGEHDPWTHEEPCGVDCNALRVRSVFERAANEALMGPKETAGRVAYEESADLYRDEYGREPRRFESLSLPLRERWLRVGRLLHEEYWGRRGD